MPAQPDSEYDDFASFVVSVEADLRYSARLAAGDEPTAELLARRALARVAQRWRWVRDDDPQALLLDMVTEEANHLWREEGVTAEEAEPDPTGVSTALILAEEAWRDGKRLRTRRRRGALVACVLIAAVLGGYVWLSNASSPVSQADSDPARAAAITATLAVLPPPDVASRAPDLDTRLPADDSDVYSTAPALSRRPVGSFAAAFQLHNGDTGVVGDNGKARLITDRKRVGDTAALFPRAIAPNGRHLVLAAGNSIVTVDTHGKVTTVCHSDSRPTDLAWYPNGKYLMLTAANGTFRVDVSSGKQRPVGWYGTSTAFDADSQGAREYVENGSRAGIQTWWNGKPHGEPRDFGVDQLPISQWDGTPFLEPANNLLVRKCLPGKRMKLPEDYSKPRSCVAVVKPSGEVSAILVLTADYRARSAASVLGAEDGQVYFLASSSDGEARLLLAWQPDNGQLHLVSTLNNAVTYVLGDIAA